MAVLESPYQQLSFKATVSKRKLPLSNNRNLILYLVFVETTPSRVYKEIAWATRNEVGYSIANMSALKGKVVV